MTTFQNELRYLARNACAQTNAQAAVTWYDDDLLRFKVKVKPNSGLYHGNVYEFTIRASDNYPVSPPIVMSCSYILHPNINEYGEVYHQDLVNWSRTYSLTFVVKCILGFFHRPDFTCITNDEIRDLTDVEFIRAVASWKQSQVHMPDHDSQSDLLHSIPSNSSQSYMFTDSLGQASCTSLMSVSRHLDENCHCNNEYIVVTNSRKPRPISARQRAFERSTQHRQQMFRQSEQLQWRQNVQFHSPGSLIDLSDVYDTLNNIEPDYEIRSVSSDEEMTDSRSTPNMSSSHTTSLDLYHRSVTTPSSASAHNLGSYLSGNPSSSRSYSSSIRSSPTSQPTGSVIDGIRSRLSSRLLSRESTWNSHQGHSLLSETRSINRNRNSDNNPKPELNKDIDMTNFL